MNDNPNPKSSASQCARIKNYLLQGNKIDQEKALNMFGCFRLASRIHDLRRKGLNIQKEPKLTSTGKKVAEYSIAM